MQPPPTAVFGGGFNQDRFNQQMFVEFWLTHPGVYEPRTYEGPHAAHGLVGVESYQTILIRMMKAERLNMITVPTTMNAFGEILPTMHMRTTRVLRKARAEFLRQRQMYNTAGVIRQQNLMRRSLARRRQARSREYRQTARSLINTIHRGSADVARQINTYSTRYYRGMHK